jgi:hypothetical protein
LRVDCVSRPADQDFARFLNDDRYFDSHCVSRRVPDYFGQRVPIHRLADHGTSAHPLAQTTLQVVVRMSRVPVHACAPVARALTGFAIAAPLTLARPCIRLEPLAALSAWSLASHRCCLLQEARSVTCIVARDDVSVLQALVSRFAAQHDVSAQQVRSQQQGWVIFSEHTRVISRKR